MMLEPFLRLGRGWHVYARQSVVFAGLALACLYLTVLGFDSMTVGTYILTWWWQSAADGL